MSALDQVSALGQVPALDQVPALESVAQVLELVAVTDPSHLADHQYFHQVTLEPPTELVLPISASSARQEVSDSAVTFPRLEASAPAPLVDQETLVSVQALAELDPPAFSREADR